MILTNFVKVEHKMFIKKKKSLSNVVPITHLFSLTLPILGIYMFKTTAVENV